MNDISQRISEIVADTMASKQAEIAGLLDKLREDIDALQQAVGGITGGQPQASPRRAARAAAPDPAPDPAPARRRRKTSQAAPAVAVQAASSRTSAKPQRREKTPEERDAISKRMTAYWQRKREEKAAGKG